MPDLFSPLAVRGVTFDNRVWVSPMCQYSAVEGVVGTWHQVHLGQFAAGGFGLVMAEATAVSADGRISSACPGLWNDEQAAAWSTAFGLLREQGTRVGIQLSHAGRKASVARPWQGGAAVAVDAGGWPTIGPSAVPFGSHPAPRQMAQADIRRLIDDFAAAAARARDLQVDVIELHAAHGYLLHQFLSPLSNQRDDEYGGSLEGRMRLVVEVVQAVRAVWPADRPLFVRLSTTDWVEGGWNEDDSGVLMTRLAEAGVDLIDASSGGLSPDQQVPADVGYQTDIAARLRARTGLLVAGVGRITDPRQAQALVESEAVDAVFLARAALRDPHWPLRAAHELGAEVRWVPQYLRASDWEAR